MGSIPIIPTFLQTWRNGLAHRISNPAVEGSSPSVCTCSVAQLVRAGSSYGQDRGFESLRFAPVGSEQASTGRFSPHHCNMGV